MKCECGRWIFPGERYGGSGEDGYVCSNCMSMVQVTKEQKVIKKKIKGEIDGKG